jgi:hypothetical protein
LGNQGILTLVLPVILVSKSLLGMLSDFAYSHRHEKGRILSRWLRSAERVVRRDSNDDSGTKKRQSAKSREKLDGAKKMKANRTLIAVLLLSLAAAAKTKDWQDGVITSIGSANRGAAAMPVGTMVMAVPLMVTQYKIETSTLVILAAGRNLNVTINKPMKVAIDGQNAFLIDDAGKERKLRIVGKAAKQPKQPEKPAETPQR